MICCAIGLAVILQFLAFLERARGFLGRSGRLGRFLLRYWPYLLSIVSLEAVFFTIWLVHGGHHHAALPG